VFVDDPAMKLSPSYLYENLIDWGWRHAHSAMVQVCKDVFKRKTSAKWTSHMILRRQLGLGSSHKCPSLNTKIDTVVTVFLASPESSKTCKEAMEYVSLFPDAPARKEKTVQKVTDAFWQIVGDLDRKMKGTVFSSGLFGIFAKKVPPPAAVSQFFRMLDELEGAGYADNSGSSQDVNIFQFVLSDICKTEDGEFDSLMEEVFDKYLQTDKKAPDFVRLFQVLLKDAKTMDVIQVCFNKLTERLNNQMEKSIFQEVVTRMKSLDAALQPSKDKKTAPVKFAKPQLPLPTEWLRFIPELDQSAPPYVVYLHGVLATWALGKEVLKANVARFGTPLFWDALDHVLLHALGSAPPVLKGSSAASPNFQALAGLSLAQPVLARTLSKTSTDAAPGEKSASGAQQQKKKVKSPYFTDLEKKKQDTYGKDVDKRIEAYGLLIREAAKEDPAEMAKAFDDLLTFINLRLTGEQENVQFCVLPQLLDRSCFTDELWMERIDRLQVLWKVWLKARGTGAQNTWKVLGRRLLKYLILRWPEGSTSPSDLVLFTLDMCCASSEKSKPAQHETAVNWGSFIVELQQQAERESISKSDEEAEDKSQGLSPDAIRWMMQVAVPLPKQSVGLLVGEDASRKPPLQQFCDLLQVMSKTTSDPNDPKQRAEVNLWERWPFVEELWNQHLQSSVSMSGAEYVLSGVILHFIARQPHVLEAVEQPNGSKVNELWWRPLETSAYANAVKRVMQQISSGEIPALQGASYLLGRIRALQIKDRMTSDHTSTAPTPFGKAADRWISTQQHVDWYFLDPVAVSRDPPDDDIHAELALLAELIERGNDLRQIQWTVMLAAAGRKGPTVDALLRRVILSLNPQQEGMARCVAKQYPYLNAALCYKENPAGNCDLLTPLLELWLDDLSTRNERVEELMQQPHAECYLFFGNAFAEHLCRRRQDLLHTCLTKVKDPPVISEEGVLTGGGEFYHHTRRGPSLARLAQLGKGWNLAVHVFCPDNLEAQCVQTSFWHPETQRLFLQKALTTTDFSVLALIPHLEFVDGVERAGELLKKHPQPQTGAVEDGGWIVIQPSGTLKSADPWEEVDRRFQEAGEAGYRNAVEDREVDQLLLALGRADHSDNALTILGAYAGKFKKAKDALVQAVPNLGPKHARRVIQDVMFHEKAGISLQVAALRLIMDLQVPDPMELYRVAWRNGACHRDVAANILSKVATSQNMSCSAEEVQDMFDIFDSNKVMQSSSSPGDAQPIDKRYPEGMFSAMSASRPENVQYIARLVLQALSQTPQWSWRFLPAVVSKLAVLPGSTNAAVQALMGNTNLVTEVVSAWTDILRNAQLAENASVSISKPLPEFQLLKDLEQQAKKPEKITNRIIAMALQDCEPDVLRGLVSELLRMHSISKNVSILGSAVSIWVRLIRRDADPDVWRSVLLEMESEIAERGDAEDLATLANAVGKHMRQFVFGVPTPATADVAMLVSRELFQRLLKKLLPPLAPQSRNAEPLTPSAAQRKSDAAREKIILVTWANLASAGCSDQEAKELFAECPEGDRAPLVENIVKSALDSRVAKKVSPRSLEVAKRSLWWLNEVEPKMHLSTLAESWPLVIEHDETGKLVTEVLACFTTAKAPKKESVLIASNIVANTGVPRAQKLEALRWLGQQYPREALPLWPKLLPAQVKRDTQEAKVAAEDVTELLQFCGKHSLEPPTLHVKACSGGVLEVLASSSAERARLMAVYALQEHNLKDKDKDLVPMLEKLRNDSCIIVRTAAKVAWVSFFGDEEEKRAAEQEVSAGNDDGGDDDDDDAWDEDDDDDDDASD